MSNLTVGDSIHNWVEQVDEFLKGIAGQAAAGGWHATFDRAEVREEPVGTGAAVNYEVPVLVLTRGQTATDEQRITFEPRYRFTIGATGRIDIYSRPAFRDAMLLRRSGIEHADQLTWEELESEIGKGTWGAYSSDRLPLKVDFAEPDSVQDFLNDLAA